MIRPGAGFLLSALLAFVWQASACAESVPADRFAEHVLAAAGLICDSHVQEFDKGELVADALRSLYRKLDIKLPADLEAKLPKLKGAKDAELTAILKDFRTRLGPRQELAGDQDAAIAARAMVARLDFQSAYIADPVPFGRHRPVQAELGARIEIDPATKMLRIVTPFRDGPAYQAGLRSGDIIAKIVRKEDRNGQPLIPNETISTRGISLDVAMKHLTNDRGTPLHLTLIEGKKETECLVVLEDCKRETLFGLGRNKDDSPIHWADRERKLAYIRIHQFSSETFEDLQREIKALKKTGMKGLILDLRFNPGGLLRAGVSVTDLFLDDGLIGSIKSRKERAIKYQGTKAGSELDFHVACLVNDESARVAEMVAACLQDHHRAVIIGERTAGNASIQNILRLPWDAALKFTTAVFYRPNGKKLDRLRIPGHGDDEWGVTPDEGYRIELSAEERAESRKQLLSCELLRREEDGRPRHPGKVKDRQFDRALEHLREKVGKR